MLGKDGERGAAGEILEGEIRDCSKAKKLVTAQALEEVACSVFKIGSKFR